jgi:hypothetical protein
MKCSQHLSLVVFLVDWCCRPLGSDTDDAWVEMTQCCYNQCKMGMRGKRLAHQWTSRAHYTFTYILYAANYTGMLPDDMTQYNLLLVTRASCHYQLLCLYYRHHTDWLIHGELKTSAISGLELQVHLQTVVHSWGLRDASLHFSTCHTVCALCSVCSSIGRYFCK